MQISETIEAYTKDDYDYFIRLEVREPYKLFNLGIGDSDPQGEVSEQTIQVTPEALRKLHATIEKMLDTVERLEQ